LDFNQEYSIIGEICNNICKDKDLVGDLTQEVALIWCELDPNKKNVIHNSNSFTWWVARTTKNLWSSSSSPFYSKYRKVKTQQYQSYNTPDPDQYDYQADEQFELMMKYVDRLFPSEYNIIHSYYFKGMTIMDIVQRFDVDKNFVWNTIKRVGRSLKRKVQWELQGWNETQLLEMVIDYVGKKRLKIEERQIVLDVYNVLHDGNFNNVYDKERILQMLGKLVIRLKL